MVISEAVIKELEASGTFELLYAGPDGVMLLFESSNLRVEFYLKQPQFKELLKGKKVSTQMDYVVREIEYKE